MGERTVRTGLEAGCSALTWHTGDGKHLWGRNYDFDRLAEGSGVFFFPRGTAYRTAAGPAGAAETARYACLGVGLPLDPAPALYEGVNEKGLMGGQLYYRELARYGGPARPGAAAVQPPLLVYRLLARCATVEEAAEELAEGTALLPEPLLGTVPPLHWCFTDRTGETLVAEPDGDGLHLYRRALGVMTNSPGYPWHRMNLLNYAGLTPPDRPGPDLGGDVPPPCFSGSGLQGLPGDWSSPARFVRLAFLRRYACPGGDEAQGVGRMFRLLQCAAFPLGLVETGPAGPAGVPRDYTAYTAVCCAESLRFYWTTYHNPQVRCADLGELLDRREPLRFPLERPAEFLRETGEAPGGP